MAEVKELPRHLLERMQELELIFDLSEDEAGFLFHHLSGATEAPPKADCTRLKKIGLIEPAKGAYRLNPSFTDLVSHPEKKNLLDVLLSEVTAEKVYPLESFCLPRQHQDALLNILELKKSSNIWITGPYDTGKTELVKTLGKQLGKKIIKVNFPDNEEARTRACKNFQRIALEAAIRSLDPRTSILLFDQADEFADEDDHFQWLSEFLTSSKLKQIWVTGSYSKDREPIIFHQKFNLTLRLEHSLEKLKWTLREKASELCLSEEVKKTVEASLPGLKTTPARLSLALTDIKLLLEEKKITDSQSGSVVVALLDAESVASKKNSTLNPMTDNYLPSLINTSERPEHLIRVMKEFREKLIAGELPPDIRNYNLLFYGQPGTGKTEFAKYISHQIGAPFIVRRSSDLIDKWLGDQEKNIRDIFAQAQEERAVLFLDECDSMFPKRENAMRAYEISRTNEMLVAMENFQGILICCTNLKDNLDQAAARRFAHKVKFDYLLKENVPAFFQTFLETGPLDEEVIARLKNLENLAPGDFNIVRKRKLMEGITSQLELVRILEEETVQKSQSKKRVGI